MSAAALIFPLRAASVSILVLSLLMLILTSVCLAVCCSKMHSGMSHGSVFFKLKNNFFNE